jgi:hypothetical protein
MKAVKLTALLTILIILGGVGTILAKYYSFEFRKGVAVASEIYFESNVLSSITFRQDTNTPEFKSFVPYMRNAGWSGDGATSASVRFEIVNYKSKLQYNKNLDIVYDLYAKLETADKTGITYTLTYGSEQYSIDSSGSETIIKDIKLEGADEKETLKSNEFTLTIVPNGATVNPKAVYIWAVPKEPSYLADKSNVLAIGSKIEITKMQQQFSVTGSFDFLSELKSPAANTDISDVIKKYTGFVYTISAMGEYPGTMVDDINHLNQVPVEISWNSSYIQMDKFSKFLSDKKNYKGSDIKTEQINGETISTMTIWLDAYSETNIVFYRVNDSGNTSLEDDKGKYQDFKELVTIQVLGIDES